jgi:hypothetical protein
MALMLTDLIPDVRTVLRMVSARNGQPVPELTDEQIIEALEQIEDQVPTGSTELERAKNADLVTLPDDVRGTNCGNCRFFDDDYCTHEKVDQPVTPRECCALWDNLGAKRRWQDSGPSSPSE